MGFPVPILEALAAGKTVLTANQRAARVLRGAFDQTQQLAGKSLWIPPPIFALDTWLPNLWSQLLLEGAESRLLLNPVQTHSVWRNIIASELDQAREVPGLRSADALADLAAEAWQILHLHNGRERLREFTVSTDTRAFAHWAESFDRTCTRNAWLTSAQLPAALAEALARGELDLPNSGLALIDFDRQTPAHESLLEDIRRAGYEVDSLQTAVATVSASLFPAQNDPTELRAAALWARQHRAENPSATIAIVVPNLADRRPQLDRICHEVLGPAVLGQASYEFSLGRPLAETPLVAAALVLLRWPLEPLPLESVSALLLSPFLAGEESLAAAEFDAFDLRRAPLLRPEISLDATIQLLRRSSRLARLNALLKHLHSLRRTAREHTGEVQSHAAWSDSFRNLLEFAGWTASAHSDSLAFQALRRWESALDSLATLDFDGSRISASAALQTLTRIARQAIFAPESASAPVQIVGPLEPGALPFDALWFLSADDRSWPIPAPSHPLIPWHIQRDLAVPGADPLRDSTRAAALTNRLAHAAPHVVFSYAQHSGEGVRRPSPLLRTLNLTPFAAPPEPVRELLQLLTVTDEEPLPPLAEGITKGGARVLELQAACAFRAFAEIRLHSTEPESRTPGLDARDRGTQVHRIMQDFWTRVQSQQTLRAMDQPERESILDTCIDLSLDPTSEPWELAYLNVQRQRLRNLLRPWLAVELSRPLFTVRQQEEKQLTVVGPLTLELRVDRIDDTASGPVILDYKTGLAAPGDWLSDRPDAPQLPLYAIHAAASEEPAGVAFALLRAGDDLRLRGFTDHPVLLGKPAPMAFATLAEQVEDWHRILTGLADAFASDDPLANPKSFPRTCERCGQRMLCRLDPTALDTSLNAAEEEEENTFG